MVKYHVVLKQVNHGIPQFTMYMYTTFYIYKKVLIENELSNRYRAE